MAHFKRGDRVVVVERETTAADRKSGLYYPHFQGLHGAVDQVYDDANEVCVLVDQESLPQGFDKRHHSIQTQVRQRWLNGISETERRSLSEEQKDLRLKYTIMVAPEDLAAEGKSRPRRNAAEEGRPVPEAAASLAPRGEAASGQAAKAAPAARRLTSGELTAAEEAHLQELMLRTKKA